MQKRIFLLLTLLGAILTADLSAQTTPAEEQLAYARRLMKEGMYDLAAEQFAIYAKQYPESPYLGEALFLRAECLEKSGNWKKALAAWNAFLVQLPDAPRSDEALLRKAEALLVVGDTTRAIALLEKFPLFYPGSPLAPAALYRAARIRWKRGDVLAAEENSRRVVEEYPKSQWELPARALLARCYIKRQNMRAAENQIDRALALNPSGGAFLELALRKAELLARLYRLKEAETLYQDLLRRQWEPVQETRLRLAYATFLLETGQVDGARKVAEPSPLLAEESRTALKDSLILLLYRSAAAAGQFSDAFQWISRLEATAVDTSVLLEAYADGAQLAAQQGDSSAALDLWMKWYGLATHSSLEPGALLQGMVSLFEVAASEGQVSLAASIGQTLVKYARGRAGWEDQVFFLLGRFYRRRAGQPMQALFYLEKIIQPGKLSRWSDEAWLEMARCYVELGQTARAKALLVDFRRQFSGSPLLAQAERLLDQLGGEMSAANSVAELAASVSDLLIRGNRDDVLLALFQQLVFAHGAYEEGIRLIRQAMARDLLEESRAEVNRLLGQSYYLRARNARDPERRAADLDSARMFYIQAAAAETDASLQLTDLLRAHDLQRMARGTPETYEFIEEHEFLTRLLSRYPPELQFPVKIRLARLLASYGRRAIRDSLRSAVKLYTDLLQQADSLSSILRNSNTIHELYFERGTALLALGDTAGAAKDLEKVAGSTKISRYRLGALRLLAQIYRNQGEHEKALDVLQAICREYVYAPVYDSALVEAAGLALEQGKGREALNFLEKVSGREFAAEKLFLLGRAHLQLENWLKARERMEEYLRRFPQGTHVAEIYLFLAKLAEKKAQKDEAAFRYDQFINRFVDHPAREKILLKRIFARLEEGKIQEAKHQFAELLKNAGQPQTRNLARKGLLLCSVKEGRFSAVLKEIERLRKEKDFPDSLLAEVEYEIGNAYLEKKSFDLAEKQFKRIQSRYKKTRYGELGRYGLGKLYMITNRDEKALEILTDLVKEARFERTRALVYLTLGDYYYKNKQFENAITAFKNALENNPSKAVKKTAERYLVKTYLDVGLYDSALLAIRRYLQDFPHEPDTFDMKIRKGITLMNLSEYQRAIAWLENLLPEANNEQEAEIRYWIAKCYYRMGQFRIAVSEFLKVPFLTRPTRLPWHVTAEYEAGLAYMKLGEYEKARELFKRIVRKEGATSDFGRVAARKLREIDELKKQRDVR